MGLDCYVKAVPKDAPFECGDGDDVWYGRKTNEIHGWMQRKSGNPADEFNIVPLELTEELLQQLHKDLCEQMTLQTGVLASTSGSFFGGSNNTADIEASVLELITETREALSEGQYVYYYSWW